MAPAVLVCVYHNCIRVAIVAQHHKSDFLYNLNGYLRNIYRSLLRRFLSHFSFLISHFSFLMFNFWASFFGSQCLLPTRPPARSTSRCDSFSIIPTE